MIVTPDTPVFVGDAVTFSVTMTNISSSPTPPSGSAEIRYGGTSIPCALSTTSPPVVTSPPQTSASCTATGVAIAGYNDVDVYYNGQPVGGSGYVVGNRYASSITATLDEPAIVGTTGTITVHVMSATGQVPTGSAGDCYNGCVYCELDATGSCSFPMDWTNASPGLFSPVFEYDGDGMNDPSSVQLHINITAP